MKIRGRIQACWLVQVGHGIKSRNQVLMGHVSMHVYIDGPCKLDVSSLHVGILHASNIQRKEGCGPAANSLDLMSSIRLLCTLAVVGHPMHMGLRWCKHAREIQSMQPSPVRRLRASSRPSINRLVWVRIYSGFV